MCRNDVTARYKNDTTFQGRQLGYSVIEHDHCCISQAITMIVTPDLLDTVRSTPNLPDDVWYIVVATALCVLNRPEDIQNVYKHAVGKGHGSQGLPNGNELVTDGEQRRIARRLREALLKASAIGGMPKVRTLPT